MKIAKQQLKEIVKEELETVLSEVEDMSRKGNAGKDFAIPSAAWDRAFRKNGIKISYHGRMGVEKDEWSKYRAQEVSGITYWPLYPVKGGYMGAYGRTYNALSDSGGGHALHLVDAAIEEAKKMCERGEYVKTGRYETSGVTPVACKKMGWSTPAAGPGLSEETLEIYKQAIKEELEEDSALLDAIHKLTRKIDTLDVSIDYLAASVTGEDPIALGFGQSAIGRAARGTTKKEIKEIIVQELQAALEAKDHPGQTCGEAHPQQEHNEWVKASET